jgi:hypothetical protein
MTIANLYRSINILYYFNCLQERAQEKVWPMKQDTPSVITCHRKINSSAGKPPLTQE